MLASPKRVPRASRSCGRNEYFLWKNDPTRFCRNGRNLLALPAPGSDGLDQPTLRGRAIHCPESSGVRDSATRNHERLYWATGGPRDPFLKASPRGCRSCRKELFKRGECLPRNNPCLAFVRTCVSELSHESFVKKGVVSNNCLSSLI